ncbi:MAG TPA: aromatic aminobenezylarsenical efflux permease ArsG family transporter [Thermodesulfobacteriota bacterium]|nr:aromatic aminobenezylarsenical efflux permease ArsG family transporter [Thermodesulfobacteriota bacterium]
METAAVPVFSALWLGILTSISPCPLASNIAAVSFLLKRVEHTSSVIASGVLYTLGRVVGYTALGVLITSSLLSIPQTSFFLQNNMNKLLGPILVVTGFFLLEVFQFTVPGLSISEKMTGKFKKLGAAGALPLGILFSLSFCPVSAALFFGSLIPLSLKNSSPVMLPSLYGIGTGLPVLVFAILITVGVQQLGALFKKVALIEYWLRRLTGVIFIVVGIYYIFTHIFHIDLV